MNQQPPTHVFQKPSIPQISISSSFSKNSHVRSNKPPNTTIKSRNHNHYYKSATFLQKATSARLRKEPPREEAVQTGENPQSHNPKQRLSKEEANPPEAFHLPRTS
jgi:hypothetical protein